jgi:hypothetical protein
MRGLYALRGFCYTPPVDSCFSVFEHVPRWLVSLARGVRRRDREHAGKRNRDRDRGWGRSR